MKVVITTQYMENYGAHDWDGEGSCPQYWKCKGGSTYVVPNLSQEEADSFDKESVLPLIEYSSEYSKEYVIGVSVHADDEVVCDSWESPVIISKQNGEWKAIVETINDEYGYMRREITKKVESYSMLPSGERSNYLVEFHLQNGSVANATNLQELMAA